MEKFSLNHQMIFFLPQRQCENFINDPAVTVLWLILELKRLPSRQSVFTERKQTKILTSLTHGSTLSHNCAALINSNNCLLLSSPLVTACRGIKHVTSGCAKYRTDHVVCAVRDRIETGRQKMEHSFICLCPINNMKQTHWSHLLHTHSDSVTLKHNWIIVFWK